MGGSMTQEQFVSKVYEVVHNYNPSIDDSSSFQEVLEELITIKENGMKWEIMTSSFKTEPELFPVTNSIIYKERRQGQL